MKVGACSLLTMSTRDSTRALKEKQNAKCGVFGAFGDFGWINLVLPTVLFSDVEIHKDGNAEEFSNAYPLEVKCPENISQKKKN